MTQWHDISRRHDHFAAVVEGYEVISAEAAFPGSSTTLIACKQEGRTARVVEIDPHYADVIRRRWAELLHGEGCDWQRHTPAVRRRAA